MSPDITVQAMLFTKWNAKERKKTSTEYKEKERSLQRFFLASARWVLLCCAVCSAAVFSLGRSLPQGCYYMTRATLFYLER